MWGGKECFEALYTNRCALVSFARPEQLKKIIPIAKSVILDNGAYSTYRKSMKTSVVVDWDKWWTAYYCWILKWYSRIDWFIIPDVIMGTENENDELINKVPLQFRDKSVPVWHSMESIDRLIKLCNDWPRVAIGLCGEHDRATSKKAKARMEEVFSAIYIENNIDVKIHGLRILDGRVLGKFPFDSGDSTFVALNVPKTKLQMVHEQRKLNRTVIYRSKIENVIPPTIEEWRKAQ